MTTLGWYLLLIVLVSLGTFGLVRAWTRQGAGADPSSLFLTHATGVALLSIGLILWFLGWQPQGAAPAAGTAPFRLEHRGFYVAEGNAISFRGDQTDHAVLVPSLQPGERFTLAPEARESDGWKLHWNLEADAWSLPLRIDGACVNLPEEFWFRPGDTLVVKDPRRGRFFSVQWTAYEKGGKTRNRWLYNQGVIRDGAPASDLDTGLILEDRPLREGLRLAAMAGHRVARELRRLEDENSGEGRSTNSRSFWQGLFGDSDEELHLHSGVTLAEFKARYRRLAPLFDQVLWVRRNLGDLSSPIGVFLDAELFPGRQVLLLSQEGEIRPLTPFAGRRPSPLRHELIPGSQVRFGFGASDAFSLELGAQRQDVAELGLVAQLDLIAPPSWQLPDSPSDELMILSREVLIPVQGFRLDVGLDREPFYAKARYRPERGGFEVNDGKHFLGNQHADGGQPMLRPGDIFRLGNADRGVVLRFLRQSSPVRYPGLLASAALLLAGLTFAGAVHGERTRRPHLDLAWTLLWGFAVALLVVRVVLSYRVAVLPPTDASVLEVRNVFQKSFLVALRGLFTVPLVLAGLRYLARGPRWAGRMETAVRGLAARIAGSVPLQTGAARLRTFVQDSSRRQRVWDWLRTLPGGLTAAGISLTLWIAIGALFARNQAMGARINIIAHLLILLGLAGAASWIVRQRWPGRLLFAAVWLLVPVFLVMVLTRDLGFGIHLPAFLLVLLLLLVWDRQRRSWAGLATLAVAVLLLVLSPLYLPRLASLSVVERWVTSAFDPATSHVYYRLATPETYGEVMARPAEEDAYNMTYLRRNSQQHWQMMLYAAEGVYRPRGYGGSPLSKIGMTYPTSMSDCVYAMYLLSEHGAGAGLLVLLLYGGIAAILIYAGAHLLEPWRARALVLIAIGGFFSLTAFYMASANLGLLVFTGQNLPLLSLVSRSDLTAGAVLLGLTTFLLRFRLNGDRAEAFRFQPWVRRICLGYLGLLALGWLGLAVRLHGMANDAGLRKDFTLPDQVYRTYLAHLPEPGKTKPLELAGEDLRVIAPGALSWPEKQFVRTFELQSDRYDPLAGLYYLEEVDSEPRVRINRSYLNLASPFSPPSPWRGSIEAHGRALPTVNLLGEGVSVRPGRDTAGETIVLNAQRPDSSGGSEVSASVVLAWGHGTRPLSLCELTNEPDGFFITPWISDPGRGVRFEVHVDGERITKRRKLQGREVIRLTGETAQRRSGRRERFSYSLMYLGSQGPTLAFSTWRNGRVRRIVSEGSLAALSEDLGRSLDSRKRDREASLPEHVVLTVDDVLHQRLERQLAAQMTQVYHQDDPAWRRRGMALTVLDAYSGELIALPSLPAKKTNVEGDPHRHTSQPEVLHLRNDNLRNHVIGSTVKPILLSAVATGYWPAGFDVGKLVVDNASDCLPVEALPPLHPHCRVAGVELETAWDCMEPGGGLIDERTFLVQSRNFYAGVLGMLGMALDPGHWRMIIRQDKDGPGSTRVTYDQVLQRLNLRWAPARDTAFTFDDLGPPRPKAAELGRTLLFRQIPLLFEVEPDLEVGDEEAYQVYLARRTSTFYPALTGAKLERSSGVESVLPDLLSLRPGLFHSTRQDLFSFFLGGGNAGRWSNIRLAEAMARIATGRKVVAHLGKIAAASGRNATASMLPPPLSDGRWRKTHVLDPLAQVGREGTAKELRDLVERAESQGYRILLKTGTLEELAPRAGQRYESELLMFVIGRWRNDDFTPGETLAGVLYLEDSKPVEVREWTRAGVARSLIETLLRYLEARSNFPHT